MASRSLLSLFFTVLGLCRHPVSGYAAKVFWTGAGDGFSWTNVSNWSNGMPPTPTDDAIISGSALFPLAGI